MVSTLSWPFSLALYAYALTEPVRTPFQDEDLEHSLSPYSNDHLAFVPSDQSFLILSSLCECCCMAFMVGEYGVHLFPLLVVSPYLLTGEPLSDPSSKAVSGCLCKGQYYPGGAGRPLQPGKGWRPAGTALARALASPQARGATAKQFCFYQLESVLIPFSPIKIDFPFWFVVYAARVKVDHYAILNENRFPFFLTIKTTVEGPSPQLPKGPRVEEDTREKEELWSYEIHLSESSCNLF
ncbi:hypothetical protein Tco_1112428 [Tanacetum coccineum]|uniref:Uncharacterized protein n=1 Tax=Tanacetum coccineum TaxID=301880 RepID=A0ABQ5IQS3_9ASTR